MRIAFYAVTSYLILFLLEYRLLESRPGAYLLSSLDSAGLMATVTWVMVGFPILLMVLESERVSR